MDRRQAVIHAREKMLMELGVPHRLADKVTTDDKPGRIEIKQLAEGEGEILLYESIGYDWWTDDGMTSQRFADELKALGNISRLTVRINSPGGDVWDGMSIYNQLASYDAEVTVIVEGIAASAASLIAMAGDTIQAYEVSQLMIHDAWSAIVGNAQEMRELADVLDKVDGQIASVYAGKSGKDAAYFRELMDKDTYLTAQEAMEIGLIHGIVNTSATGKTTNTSARNRRLIDLARVKVA